MTPAAYKGLKNTAVESFPALPPFAKNVQTAPLLIISLVKLARGDVQEQDRLWQACCQLGFFYLNMRMDGSEPIEIDDNRENDIDGAAILDEKDQIFDLMVDLYKLPEEQKHWYNRSAEGIYFG